jgi:hypothetical protein
MPTDAAQVHSLIVWHRRSLLRAVVDLRAVVNVEDMDNAAFPAVPVQAALFYRRALLMLHDARRRASCW